MLLNLRFLAVDPGAHGSEVVRGHPDLLSLSMYNLCRWLNHLTCASFSIHLIPVSIGRIDVIEILNHLQIECTLLILRQIGHGLRTQTTIVVASRSMAANRGRWLDCVKVTIKGCGIRGYLPFLLITDPDLLLTIGFFLYTICNVSLQVDTLLYSLGLLFSIKGDSCPCWTLIFKS